MLVIPSAIRYTLYEILHEIKDQEFTACVISKLQYGVHAEILSGSGQDRGHSYIFSTPVWM